MPSVTEPSTLDEAAAVFKEAQATKRTVSIERDGGDVVLSTRRLDRVLEHEAGDLTITIESGLRLGALRELLDTRGQMLSLDPPGDPSIGGVIAGDRFGPRAFRFGRARDLLLGVTVVLADGTVASAGGKVVKNVAGYDLGKLFSGSAGRLGLIVRASFRLHPIPEVSRVLVADVKTANDAANASRLLLESPLEATAADLLWPGRLVLLFEGSERAVDDQTARAAEILGARENGEVWAELSERQRGSTARKHFGAGDLRAVLEQTPTGLIRLGPTCYAFTSDTESDAASGGTEQWSDLAERVRAEFDPIGTLA